MEFNLDITESLLPNLLTLLAQLAATGVLFFFMKKLAWQPVRKILDTRAEAEQNKLKEAERLKAESEQMKNQAQNTLQTAGAQAKELIEVGNKEGQRIKEELVAKAKQESEETLTNARREIAYEKEQMRDEVQKEIVDVALLAAEKLLNEKLDEQKDRHIVESFVQSQVKQ